MQCGAGHSVATVTKIVITGVRMAATNKDGGSGGGGGGLSGWLQRVRKTGEYSDVQVIVSGVEFRLHMLPLMNASSYFRNLPSSSSSSELLKQLHQQQEPHGAAVYPRVVSIPELPGGAEGFGVAADMCYLLKPSYTVQNAPLVCATAEFLGMEEVQESAKKFMHTNIFSHWRFCINFLQQFTRTGCPVDEYVESRCQKVLVAACVKSFTETKHLSAPATYISGPLTSTSNPIKQSSSPCQTLTELLVQVCSLPDAYAAEMINTLVESDVNLNLKCRQGRNVRSWLDNVMEDECRSDRARSWVLLCLSRMLLKGAPVDRPCLELSSQYWCSLLEHADHMVALHDGDDVKTACCPGQNYLEDVNQFYIKERLVGVKALLEEKIGESLEELDEYLHDYKVGPDTLMSMVEYYVSLGEPRHEQILHEIVTDVDSFLWCYANEGCISIETFMNLVKVFPSSSRASHDTIYGAIEKLLSHLPECSEDEQQQLWGLVDHFKLSPSTNERALSNPMFLSQPEILESVLQHHSQELSKVDETDGHHLRHIMHKVINASLKLLEENSRRSREILELQKQCGELLTCRTQLLENDEISRLLRKPTTEPGKKNFCLQESETEESEASDIPSIATVSTSVMGSGRRRLADMFRDEPDCATASF